VRTSDFDYHLPPEAIAQRPARPRDSSRLLVLHRDSGDVEHRIFGEITDYLHPGDALVLNETRVIPARLRVRKIPTGGHAELLLLRQERPAVWEAMAGGKGLGVGRRLEVVGGPVVEIIEDLGGPRRLVRFQEPILDRLDELGEMPLPPYIQAPLRDRDEYQTTFARRPGSAAAPTAGLHFTPRLLGRIERQGVRLVRITLHIGLDTFVPVREEDPSRHAIHTEWCELDAQAAETLNTTTVHGGRIIAVGTTSVRALESAARIPGPGRVQPFQGSTDLFILPGFEFRATDAMVTNFHLPRSTLLMMVSAFAGRERILETYRLAIERGYRFYSFGDAMLIL